MEKMESSPLFCGFKSNPFPTDNSCPEGSSQFVPNNTPGDTMIPQQESSSEVGHNQGLLVGAFLVLSLAYIVRRHKKNNVVGNLPGPRSLPILGNVQMWSPYGRFSLFLKWSNDYGPCFTVRAGPTPVVVLNSVEYIQKLLSSSEAGHLYKNPVYEVFRPLWRDGLILSNPEKWRQRRKILSRAFTHASLTGYMHSFNKHSQRLSSQLEQLFEEDDGKGKPINMLLLQLAFLVICETTLGIDAKEHIKDEMEVLEILEDCKAILMNRAVKPWLFNKFLWYFHPDKETLSKGSKAMGAFAQKIIDHHRSVSRGTERTPGPEGEHNLVPGVKRQFVSLLEEGIEAGMDDEGLIEETLTIIITGYESSATTIQFFLMLLATHSEDQDKCRREVDEIFEDASLSPGGELTLEGVSRMHYLQKCLDETLRLYPIIFAFLRNLKAPLKLDDNLELPAGTGVGIFAPGIHRNPEYFPNPDQFIPDRFSKENSKGRSPYSYLAFSMGPRNCIGFKFGHVEIKTSVAWILRNFEVSSKEKMEDVRILLEIGLTPEHGYNFSLKRRVR